MVFGERLRLLRHRKYSQEELANLLHVHNNTISKWESGTQAPRMTKMKELASILGTTVAYLMGDTDNPLPPEHKQEEQVKNISNIEHTEADSCCKESRSALYWDKVAENVDDVLVHGSRELIFYMCIILLRAASKVPPEIKNDFLLSGISAYNGNNSSYSAAVMSVNTAIDNVKGA